MYCLACLVAIETRQQPAHRPGTGGLLACSLRAPGLPVLINTEPSSLFPQSLAEVATVVARALYQLAGGSGNALAIQADPRTVRADGIRGAWRLA